MAGSLIADDLDENHPIYVAIDVGGGQMCDVHGVLRALREAGYEIVQIGESKTIPESVAVPLSDTLDKGK